MRKQKEKNPLHSKVGIVDNLIWQVREKDLEDWGSWVDDGELELDAFSQKKGP